MALKAIPLVIQNNAAGIDYLFSFSVSGKGIGKALLKRVSAVSFNSSISVIFKVLVFMHLTTKNLVFFQIAVERKCTRLDWHVLNWNKLALDFYDRIGAVCLDGWRLYRLTGKRLLEFADKKQE